MKEEENSAQYQLAPPAIDFASRTENSTPSSSSDRWLEMQAISPGEYRDGGSGLALNFEYLDTMLGRMLAASTIRGLTHLAFVNGSDDDAMQDLHFRHPRADFIPAKNSSHKHLESVLCHNSTSSTPLKLHVRGTPFQLKVWDALLKVPSGQLTTYSQVAKAIGHSSAHRAVGGAIGSNPIAFLIPCHRVIKSSGKIGDYRWGTDIKIRLIADEMLK